MNNFLVKDEFKMNKMSLFAQELHDFLISICHPFLVKKNDSRELRIFLSSFPPEIIYPVGQSIMEYFAKVNSRKPKVVFKIGVNLWQDWQSKADNSPKILSQIENKEWVDKDDRLTYYRNLKWDPSIGKDCMIVILVGVEQATDQASLEDFFLINEETIWSDRLDNKFAAWIEKILNYKKIEIDKNHMSSMDELLRVLHQHYAGDLLLISEFLDNLSLDGAVTSYDVLKIMYRDLPFCNLPIIKPNPKIRKWTLYVKSAIEFFSYQKYLKESERRKANAKIDQYMNHIRDGGDPPPLYDFKDTEELTICLKSYINNNDREAKKRLLKYDYRIIKEDILEFTDKNRNGKDPKPPSEKEVKGNPLEIVLTAMWIAIAHFQSKCAAKNVIPADALTGIVLTGRTFTRDTGSDDDARKLLKGVIGGIDEFIEKYLSSINPDIDDDSQQALIESNLLDENIDIRRTNTGKAKLQFEIHINASDNLGTRYRFKWFLSDTHPFRTLWNFSGQVLENIESMKQSEPGPILPIFHIPYYNEIFHSPDEEEINRIINLGLLTNLEVCNLIGMPGVPLKGEAWHQVGSLCESFFKFIKDFVNHGYFTAIKDKWQELQDKTSSVYKLLIDSKTSNDDKEFAPLVYKAFLLTSKPSDEQRESFNWSRYLDSAVITPLHPALMEMLFHQEIFLINGWLDQMRPAIKSIEKNALKLKDWDDVRDLVGISYPLFGFINKNHNLETHIESFGLIHRYGKPHKNHETLTSKIIQKYEAPEEEAFSDTEMFWLNREAKLISHLLDEYTSIYPYSNDGISLAILNIRDIQFVIAGIDDFLSRKLERSEEDAVKYPPYQFNLVVFSYITESHEIARWLNEWQKRWDPAHGRKQYDYYQNCRLSVTHKVVEGRQDYISLLTSLEKDLDISILSRFMEEETHGTDFEKITAYEEPDWDNPLKFPILEMPRCADEKPSSQDHRARVISNRRFQIATLHSELSARFRFPDAEPEKQHVVVSKGDYSPWRGIIDWLHTQTGWVLCLDPCVDEKLLMNKQGQNINQREIIGFSSGVGSHGELNYTISTENASISDIKTFVGRRVKHIFHLEHETSQNAADTLVDNARKLSGLPLIKAVTDKDEKIRDVIAFALVHHCLPKPNTGSDLHLCDELISLDTFRHWFRKFDDDSQMYPDLIRIVAHLNANGIVRIYAHLFECKLANNVNRYIEKAHQQLENGLHHLIPKFSPRQRNKHQKYDQRFWWAQLQRIIANKAVVPSHLIAHTTAALEKLGNGEFIISWGASAITIWADYEEADTKGSEHFSIDSSWSFQKGKMELSILLISCNGSILKDLASKKHLLPITNENETFIFRYDSNGEAPHDQGQVHPEPENPSEEDKPSKDMSDKEKSNFIQGIPARIFLGLNDQGRDIYWEYGHPELTNRHLLIFGKSGVGKTYAIQALLYELGICQQNAMIIDYTDGFLPDHLEGPFKETTRPRTYLVRHQPLPINPFRKQIKIIEGFDPIPDNSHTVGGRITSVINSVYSTIGEQQRAVLTETIAEGIDQHGETYAFQKLLQDLKDNGTTGTALANKISPLVHENIFSGTGSGNWQSLFEDPNCRVSVFQLAGISRDIARIATEFILWDFYDFATSTGCKNKPLPIILDEIQNLDHRLESPLGKSLTEGRKFGLSLILATQTLSNLKTDERDRLFQASHKLFFKPAETEVKEYAKLLEQSSGEKSDLWISRLNNLNKGECYSLGPYYNKTTKKLEHRALKISITSFEDRIKRTPKNG